MRMWLVLSFVPALAMACGSSPNDDDNSGNADGGTDASVASDARADASGNTGADASGADASGAADAGPCGSEMAFVDFEGGVACVDLYEGALRTTQADGGDTAWPYNESVDALDAGYRAVVAQGIKPQGYISSDQAEAACNASGKRLCTLDEWTAACRGRPAHDYVYPYGDTYEPGACNEGKESPIIELFGPDPSYSEAELSDPRCDELEGGLAKGGDYPKCVSTYGAFDMHGNIHEWVADDTNPTHGTFMGGYFVDATINGAGCTYRTTAHEKAYHDYSTGFRCCADPK